MLGDSIVARLAEAAAAGQDGIVVFFPDAREIRVPRVVIQQHERPRTTDLARRLVAPDPDWSLVGLRA
ncbi:MAG: hypothetical protein U0556_03865 [Dehalococcoidia bacterium]